MEDNLVIINRIITKHRGIRERVKLTGQSVSDLEALFSLQQGFSTWSQSSLEALVTSRSHLLEAIGFLEEGLNKHFDYEEKALPPLFGRYLMNSLLLEHHQIKSRMSEAKDILASTVLEQLSNRELLLKKSEIQQTISDICQVVEEHAGHEEIILNMLKKSLESKPENDSGTG